MVGVDKLTHKPALALFERNPWLMVVGSDVPSFILYEDGLVVFHQIEDEDSPAKAYTANIGPKAATKFLADIDATGLSDAPDD